MNHIQLKIISPQGIIIDQLVDIVTVRTITGYAGFLAGHIPYVSTIIPSQLTFRVNNVLKTYFINGGILPVEPEFVQIITDKLTSEQDRQQQLQVKSAWLKAKLQKQDPASSK